AVSISVAHEGVVARADLPVASHQVTVGVVLQVWRDDIVVRVERPRSGGEVGLRDDVEYASGSRLYAVGRNLVVEERPPSERVNDRAVTELSAARAVGLILHSRAGGGVE